MNRAGRRSAERYLVAHMQTNGVQFRKPISEQPTFRYVMVAAPDNVLVELFQTRRGPG